MTNTLITVTAPNSTEFLLFKDICLKAGITINGTASFDIKVYNEKLYSRIIQGGSLALGDSYVEGWWDSDCLDETLSKIISAQESIKILPFSFKVQIAKSKILNMQTKLLAKRVAQQHYDLSNDFYALMLDPFMQYTCGYWQNATTLNQAQEDKLDQICKKLKITQKDHVLELGCGFGGFAKFAAERYGCSVVGYNISKEQLKWARDWTKSLPIEFIEKDYREASGSFDKVVSIGLCEHVGYKNYSTLMHTVHRCLKDGGLFLLHSIGGNISAVTTDAWLEKYIFPGSVMPSPSQITKSFEDLFILEDWHNFGVDYDKTLMAWYDNFNLNWSTIMQMGFDQKFYRMWKYYLLLCAASFRVRKNQNWEIVLSKGELKERYSSLR